MLARTAGVKHLVVLINKMDDPTVNWDEARFKECRDKLKPFLKRNCAFKDDELFFMPASSYTGAFIKDTASELCPWYTGPSLLDHLDSLPKLNNVKEDSPFIMPITGKHKDMGTIVTGKIESGLISLGSKLLIMPNRTPVEAVGLYYEDKEVTSLQCGDNGRIKLKGIEEEDIFPGMVLCDTERPCKAVKRFQVKLWILEAKSIICKGYSAVLHAHAATEEVKVSSKKFLKIDKLKPTAQPVPTVVARTGDIVIAELEVPGRSVCVGTTKEFDGRLSRFTLRDEGKTVAMGQVEKIVE